MRRPLQFQFLLAALCVGTGSLTAKAAPPNILLIQADDLGWSDLGCQGAAHHKTPAIDALARQGLRFTQAYAGAPVCTPARAALVTGLHAARLRTTGQPGYKTEDTSRRRFAHPDFATVLPSGVPTIARTLSAAGYHAVSFGKWGFDDTPQDHGFVESTPGSEEALVDAALAYLSRRPARPFFMYFNFFRPHTPLRPEPARVAVLAGLPEFRDGRRSPAYAAEIEQLDRETGRLLVGLARLGLDQDTVVIFTSDNGGFLGYDHERVADNSPLREGKASLYEGGLRVPLIVRWPGVAPRGTTSDLPVHGVDWHATLAEIAGAVTPAGLDGSSFVPALRGSTAKSARPLFWHFPHYRRALAGRAASPSSAVRDGDWKLIHFYETDAVELYDLANDPGEARDLAASRPQRAAALRALLEDWRRRVGAQPPVPNPPDGRLSATRASRSQHATT